MNFYSILGLLLQDSSGNRAAAVLESVKHPDLSKFLVIAAILWVQSQRSELEAEVAPSYGSARRAAARVE